MNLRKKYMKYMNISVQAKRGFIFCSRHAGLTASEPQRTSARGDDHHLISGAPSSTEEWPLKKRGGHPLKNL